VENSKAVIRYLQGRRRGKAANRVEREAMRDPFLAEALSGYDKRRGRHVRVIRQLRRQLRRQIEAPGRRRVSFRWPAPGGFVPTLSIFGRDWLELVFAERNRAYGAYSIRRYSSCRHLLAFAVTACMAAIACLLPTVVQRLRPASRTQWLAVAELSYLHTDLPDDASVAHPEIPPPPPLKSAIRFTVLQVVEDEKVADGEVVKTMEELVIAPEAISVADVVGSDEAEGIDIADLEAHKIVMADGEPVFPVGSVEQNPAFPGGMEALYKWINHELRYPAAAQEMGIAGRVVVQFVVGRDGRIRDVTLLRGIDPSLDEEALRVVAKMPVWIPGKQGGREVAVRYVLPVVFRIK
jgi:protein TonB